LSLAFHETGHALGMSASNDSTVYETQDDDYDFDPDFVGGQNMAANILSTGSDVRGHLDDIESVMYPSLSIYSARTLPSAVDVFSMAAGHHYENVNLPRQEFLTGDNWNLAGNWEGNQVPLSDDDVWVRHDGNVSLSGFGQAQNLTVAGGSILSTGEHTLSIDDGLTIGDDSNTGGTVAVLGGGAIEVGSVTIGNNGQVLLGGGSSLAVGGQTIVDSGGTLTLGSGTFTSRGVVVIGGKLVASTAEGEEGTLVLANVRQVSGYGELSLPIHLGTKGTVSGSETRLKLFGHVSGSGSISGALIFGNVSPGNSAGQLRMTDVELSSSGTLSLEFGGTDSQQYDQVTLDGTTALDGNLEVDLIDSFVPQVGDTFSLFRLVSDVNLQGDFSNVLLTDIEIGSWDASGLLSSGNLLVISSLPALAACDFNGDTVCDVADINLMTERGDLVTGVSVGEGNQFHLNTDENIDNADVDQWLSEAATENGYGSPFQRGDTDEVGPGIERDVDITDFNVLVIHFDLTGANEGNNWSLGDFDGNGKIDITDFSINFLPSFSATGGGTYGPNQSVPEPSTMVLLAIGGVLLGYISNTCSKHGE
jgi:hypothetical protein